MAFRVPRRASTVRAFAASEKGAAAVEFALVGPIVVAIVLGLLEFGIFSWNRHSLEHATHETARLVLTKTEVTNEEVSADLKSRVSGIDAASLTTTITQETIGTTKFVTLSVSYTHTFSLLGAVVGLEPVTLTSQTRVPLRPTE